jgi:fructose-1,6-bisphosphatase/inositol monophosphatase family enzyme
MRVPGKPVVSLVEARARLNVAKSEFMVNILRDLHEEISAYMIEDPQACFERIVSKYSEKELLGVDHFAENAFMDEIRDKLGDVVSVIGEESLPRTGLDLAAQDGIVILCDIIDGTDLLVRGMSNWCSAMVAFEPSQRTIIAAHVHVVGRGVDTLYSAYPGRDGVTQTSFLTKLVEAGGTKAVALQKIDRTERIESAEIVRGVSGRAIDEAGIFSYGQKLKNFRTMANTILADQAIKKLNDLPDVRFYNLGGNPVACRIVEGKSDILFDFHGQAAHDIIPGAIIALCGMAVMYLAVDGLDSFRKVSIADMIPYLLRPCPDDSRLRYVIAGSDLLARQFINLTRPNATIA